MRERLARYEGTRSALSGSVCAQVSIAVAQVIATPVFLKSWSTTDFALWIIFLSVANTVSAVDFGIPGTIGNKIVNFVSTQRYEEASWWRCVLFRALLVTCAGVVIISLSVPLFTSTFNLIPWQLFFAAIAYATLLAGSNSLLSLLRAYGGNATAIWISAISTAFESGCPLLLAWNGVSIYGCAACLIIIRLVVLLTSSVVERGFSGPLAAKPQPPPIGALSVFAWTSVSAFFLPLSMAALQQLPLLMLSSREPSAVVAFTTARTLCRLVLQAAFTYPRISLPYLAAAVARQDQRETERIARRYAVIIWIGAVAACSFILLFGLPVYRAWTNFKIAITQDVFSVIMASVFLECFWYTCLSMLVSINKHAPAATILVFAVGVYGAAAACWADSLSPLLLLTLCFGIAMSIIAPVMLRAAGLPIPSPFILRTFGR